jgi:hypothetical protein
MRAPPEVPHDTVLAPASCNPALIFVTLSHPGELRGLESVTSKPNRQPLSMAPLFPSKRYTLTYWCVNNQLEAYCNIELGRQ